MSVVSTNTVPAIELIHIDRALARRLNDGEFSSHYGVDTSGLEGLMSEVVGATLGMMEAVPREDPWGCYLIADSKLHTVVGTCGFKSGPVDGAVEIATFTFPPFEGKGYAKAMARALLALAESSDEVTEVIAHTLPEENSSTSVLNRLGFKMVGSVEDPEDGTVWQWRISS